MCAFASYILYKAGVVDFGTELNASFWGAGIAFVVDAIVSVVVTLATTPKPDSELRGLVYGLSDASVSDDTLAGDAAWYRSPLSSARARLSSPPRSTCPSCRRFAWPPRNGSSTSAA